MALTSVALYEVDIPLRTAYRFSGGRSHDRLKTIVVRLEDRDGVVGWGAMLSRGANLR